MSGAVPWSVKGIEPRAREAAREAARRQGLTIGEWLNQAILANEAALAAARGEAEDDAEAPSSPAMSGREQSLSHALRQLAERMEIDDRRNALAMSGIDRSLAAVAARVERAETESRAESGRVSDLLDELRAAQAVLLEQMQRIEDEELPALRAEAGAGRIGAVETELQTLSARALAAEAATGEALAKLDGAMSALDAKLAEAVTGEQLSAQAENLKERFEAGLDTMAQDVAAMIAETRADIAGQIVSALGGLQPEEMNEALADMSRRLAAAERRHTQTIEAVSIEIKRLSESMDRRLRVVEARNDDNVGAALREEIAAMSGAVEQRLAEMETREAAAFSRIGDEVGRIAERLDVRVATSEARSAAAIEQVGEQVSLMAERLGARQDKFAAEITERIVQSEERHGGRLSQALAAISARLGAIETNTNEALSPVSQAMDTFAARLKAIESRAGAPVVLPDVEPPLAPAYLDAPAREPEAPAAAPARWSTLEHEPDLHAGRPAEPEPDAAPDRADAPAADAAADAIYLEDIEAEFEQRLENPAFTPALDTPAEHGATSLDDPFADIEASPPEDDDGDLWSTGRPDEADPGVLPPVERFEPYKLPRALEEAEPLADPFDFADPLPEETPLDHVALDRKDRALIEEEELESDVFGLDEREALSAPAAADYLAAARRAAQAGAAARREHAAGASPRLRGLSRVILWGATGALAAALAGGVYAYYAQHGQDRAPKPRKDAALATPPPGSIAEAAAKIAGQASEALPARALPVDLPEAPAHAGPLDESAAHPTSAIVTTVEAAAAAGDPVAQYDLALAKRAAGDDSAAVDGLRRAAGQGLAMAQYRLAKLYERGEGVPADLAQARQWTERAAIAGNRKAMHDLGVYYARGEGAPFDEATAFKWFRQAAEYGVTDSQFNLGVLYSQGRGVAVDAAEAFYWFSVAAAGGDADARARATVLARQLDGKTVESVNARVRAFRPRPAIARANGEFGPRPWAPGATLQAAADAAPRT